MNGVCDQVLAGAGGAPDQHRRRLDVLQPLEHLEHTLHGRALAEDLAVGARGLAPEVAHLGGEAVLLENLPHREGHLSEVEGLGQVGLGPEAGRLDRALDRAVGGQHDDGDVVILLPDGAEHVHSTHLRHLHVGEDEVRAVGHDLLQAVRSVLRFEDEEALSAQVLTEGPADELLVVADQDCRALGHLALHGGAYPTPGFAVSLHRQRGPDVARMRRLGPPERTERTR